MSKKDDGLNLHAKTEIIDITKEMKESYIDYAPYGHFV